MIAEEQPDAGGDRAPASRCGMPLTIISRTPVTRDQQEQSTPEMNTAPSAAAHGEAHAA